MNVERPSGPEEEQATAQLYDLLRNSFLKQYGVDIQNDPIAQQRFEQAAVQAYQDLMETSQAVIHLTNISVNDSGPYDLKRTISREDFRSQKDSADSQEPDKAQAGSTVQVQMPDRTPYLTYIIMGVSIFLYLLQMGTLALFNVDFPAEYGMKINQRIIAGEYWRLLTPVFLHGSLLHIGFNMYALFIMGRRIERIFGPIRFLLLYAIAGMAGNIGSFLFTQAPSLGSSTAIFGLLGAEGVFIYQHRRLFGSRFRRQLWQIIQLAGINLFIGLSPGIDNWGHIGGLVGGSIFTITAGPLFQLEGLPPLLKVRDERSQEAIFLTAFVLFLVLVGIVGFAIRSRG